MRTDVEIGVPQVSIESNRVHLDTKEGDSPHAYTYEREYRQGDLGRDAEVCWELNVGGGVGWR